MSKNIKKEGGTSSKKSALVTRYRGFEVLCVPNSVAEFREGHLPLTEVLSAPDVYTDAAKFIKATQAELDEGFPTILSMEERIKTILLKGDFQLTTEERRKLIEQRRNQVTNYFSTNFLDPTTNKPHPAARIDLALDTYKIKIDFQIPLKKQVELVKKELMGKLPLKPNKASEEGIMASSSSSCSSSSSAPKTKKK